MSFPSIFLHIQSQTYPRTGQIVHTFNPSTWRTKANRSQPDIPSKSQDTVGYIETLSGQTKNLDPRGLVDDSAGKELDI